MYKDLASRIAIIGGGISGITTALSLKSLGYHNIVIIERDDKIGGKIETIYHNDLSNELGAYAISAEGLSDILEFDDNDVSVYESPPVDVFDLTSAKRCSLFKHAKKSHSSLSIVKAIYRFYLYTRELHQNFDITKVQYVDSDLYLPFSTFCRRHNFEAIADLLKPSLAGLGYGYVEDVPAIYYMAYFSPSKLKSYLKAKFHLPNPGFKIFKHGFSNYLEEVSQQFDLRLNCNVLKVEREHYLEKTDKICLQLEGHEKPELVDYLVNSCAPCDFSNYMDFNEQERLLFSDIHYNDYFSSLVILDKTDNKRRISFLANNCMTKDINVPVLMVKNYRHCHHYLFYAYGNQETTTDDITAGIKATVSSLNWEYKQTIANKRTANYFPYASSEAIRNGFYQKVANLQGQKNTFYVGSVFDFEGTGRSVLLAKSIIKQYFGSMA